MLTSTELRNFSMRCGSCPHSARPLRQVSTIASPASISSTAEAADLSARSEMGNQPSQPNLAIVSLDRVLEELSRRHRGESGRGNQNSGCEQQFTDHGALLQVIRLG